MTLSRLLMVFLCFMLAGSQLSVAQNNKPNGDRISFIKRLLESSSAARKVMESENPDVKSLYKDAWFMYRRAIEAKKYDDNVVMNEALFHATENMFMAVRLMEHKKLMDDKKQLEFNRRLESINALLKAHERISQEKKVRGKHSELSAIVQLKVAAANDMVSDGKINAAYKIADEAYVQIKTSISKLRSGETLVRSLHFATAREEFLYEMDRNDTHKMLVKLLLEEKLKNKSLRKMTEDYLKKAKLFRQQAEEQAANNDYKAAIKSCEKSTRQFVRAIRAAGLYIPG